MSFDAFIRKLSPRQQTRSLRPAHSPSLLSTPSPQAQQDAAAAAASPPHAAAGQSSHDTDPKPPPLPSPSLLFPSPSLLSPSPLSSHAQSVSSSPRTPRSPLHPLPAIDARYVFVIDTFHRSVVFYNAEDAVLRRHRELRRLHTTAYEEAYVLTLTDELARHIEPAPQLHLPPLPLNAEKQPAAAAEAELDSDVPLDADITDAMCSDSDWSTDEDDSEDERRTRAVDAASAPSASTRKRQTRPPTLSAVQRELHPGHPTLLTPNTPLTPFTPTTPLTPASPLTPSSPLTGETPSSPITEQVRHYHSPDPHPPPHRLHHRRNSHPHPHPRPPHARPPLPHPSPPSPPSLYDSMRTVAASAANGEKQQQQQQQQSLAVSGGPAVQANRRRHSVGSIPSPPSPSAEASSPSSQSEARDKLTPLPHLTESHSPGWAGEKHLIRSSLSHHIDSQSSLSPSSRVAPSPSSAASSASHAQSSDGSSDEETASTTSRSSRLTATEELSAAEKQGLLEDILLLYVEIFFYNPKAFAPFFKGQLNIWRDRAQLVYRSIMASSHHTSRFNSWKAQWKTRSIKTRLLDFFEQQLRRLNGQVADPQHPFHFLFVTKEQEDDGIAREKHPHLYALLKKAKGAFHHDDHTRLQQQEQQQDDDLQPVQPELSVSAPMSTPSPEPLPPITVTAAIERPLLWTSADATEATQHITGPVPRPPSPRDEKGRVNAFHTPPPAYFRRLNAVCLSLHRQYLQAAEAIDSQLVRSLLTPDVPLSITSGADLNRAIVHILHRPQILQLLTVYHPAYQQAVCSFPGLPLMSHPLRQRIESRAFTPLTLTDLIVAVNDLTDVLRRAFQKLLWQRPKLLQELVASQRFSVLREMREEEVKEAQREREKGLRAYPESFSFWLYDSQLYPRQFSNETLAILRHVSMQDADLLFAISAHRYSEAIRRLRELKDDRKALWLEHLLQKKKQERETSLMSRRHQDRVVSTTTSSANFASPESSMSLTSPLRSPAVSPTDDGHTASSAEHPEIPELGLSIHILSPDGQSDHEVIVRNWDDTEEHAAAMAKVAGPTSTPQPSAEHASQMDDYEDITAGRPEYAASKVLGSKDHTALTDIVKWVDVSVQYVVGFGLNAETSQLEAWAVYDKTFNEPLFDSFKGTLEMGFMSRKHIHNHQQQIKQFKSCNNLTEFLHSVLFSSSATTSQSIRVTKDFFSDPLLIWKPGRRPDDLQHLDTHGRNISFDDFDWLQMFVDNASLQHLVQSFTDLNDLVNPQSEKRRPLNHSDFIPQPDGTYLLSLHRSKTIQPVKVIDIHYPKSSFASSATRASFTTAIKGGLSGIPFYGPTQAVNALLERVFDFTDILYLQRHAQALLLVVEAIVGNPTSPFSSPIFTRENLEVAVYYLLRTNIMLSAVFVNLLSKDELLSSNYLGKINAKRAASIAHLEARHMTVIPLPCTYFALSFKREKQTGVLTKLKIHALAFTKMGRSKKPHAAVDFFKPHRERRKRLALSYVLTGTNFLYVPFPGIGGVAKLLYKELVIREIQKRQMWESGLLAHIAHNAGELSDILVRHLHATKEVADKYEAHAVHILEERRLSPFDLSHSEQEHHREIVESWIRTHDPEYLPLKPTYDIDPNPHQHMPDTPSAQESALNGDDGSSDTDSESSIAMSRSKTR